MSVCCKEVRNISKRLFQGIAVHARNDSSFGQGIASQARNDRKSYNLSNLFLSSSNLSSFIF